MNKLLVGIGVVVIALGVASWLYFASDSRTPVERIADDTKLPDAEALDQMARAVFNRVEKATCEDVSGGIRQSIEILGSVVNIPEAKFSAIQDIKFSMNSMDSINKDFARAGVVKFDGFEQVVYK